MEYNISGWPAANEVPLDLREMYRFRHNFTVIEDMLFYMNRLVIPEKLRNEMLVRLHSGHMGVTKTQLRAKQTMWWPGINQQVEETVGTCEHCQIHRDVQHAEPLMTHALPERPWQRISADLLTHKTQCYMAVSDEYSRWLEIVKMKTTTSSAVITEFKKLFACWGFPDVLTCDNGTQFVSSEFRKFAADCDFIIETSSPRYPQSNGGSENAVKQAKKILYQKDPNNALMEYRATSTTVTGYSPCELLQQRRMKTRVPMTTKQLLPKLPDQAELRDKHSQSKRDQAKYHDQRKGVRNLTPLRPGDSVRLRTPDEKTWSKPATIVGDSGPRSYLVDTGDGVLRRNRRHIQAIPSQSDADEECDEQFKPEPVIEPVQDIPEQHVEPEPAQNLRRSTRVTRMPKRYDDYIVYRSKP